MVPHPERKEVPSACFEIPKSVILTQIGEGDAMRIFYCNCQPRRFLRLRTHLWLQVTMANFSLMQYNKPF